MFEFLIRKSVVKSTQKFIDQLEPKVNIQIPQELPLPSIKMLKPYCLIVSKVNGLEAEISQLSEDQLREKTKEFQVKIAEKLASYRAELQKLEEEQRKTTDFEAKETFAIEIERVKGDLKKAKNQVLDEILPEAFAVVREVGKRKLNMRHFDIQLVGGMVLNGGNIAEMTTGEGKTLVATLPTYLNALTGEGAHVVTVNDYLASRDRDWMAPIFETLGLTIGVIQHDMEPNQRQAEYACDITYGTNNEFGFDYLRDNMVNFKEDMAQRPHHFAVIDEVDSILVDEARTPLIISGPAEESTDKYYRAYEISKNLTGKRITEKDEVDAKYKEIDLSEGVDYLADEKAKSVSLTEQGESKGAELFGVDNLHDMETIEYRHHILQALKAKEFFINDVDYVVRDGEVIIVDEFTGRMMPGRRWSDGLHQAVEAREGIKIARENQTLATITFQNYFRLYEKLSGMTGTADTEATEFKQIYDLDVVVMPTNKVLKRKNYTDQIYKSTKEKYDAVVNEIEEHNKIGQPVLVGTISIEKSEYISTLLTQKGVPHKVLNAKQHMNEASIIAQAGRKGAVTIATNMAGRGTDIVLGGNAEALATNLVEQKSQDIDDEQAKGALTEKFLKQFESQCKEEQAQVIEAGGLHVIGTERHESRRIDNQLRGRQGRQGDPGSSIFYVSLEDDLMRLFASDKIIGLMDKLGMEEGQSLEHPWLNKALENAQKKVETHNFEIRKHLLEYDDVMNKQREVIYNLRRSILESDDVKGLVFEAIEQTVCFVIDQHLSSDQERWDVEGLEVYLRAKYNYDLSTIKSNLAEMDVEQIKDDIVKVILESYDAREQKFEVKQLRYVEKMVFLNTIDAKWKDHLYAMDQLKEGVGLRSYAQRDPVIEYKKEGYAMFEMMYYSINQEIAEIICKVQPAQNQIPMQSVFNSLPQELVHKEAEGFSNVAVKPSQQQASQQQDRPVPIQKNGPKVGRNDPCPCGSQKKYKKCCGR